jgi:hypothetical protein
VALLYSRSDASFVAGAVSSYLGRHVEIGDMQVTIGQALTVELRDIAIYEGPDSSGPPLVQVPYAVGTQSWPRLLVGQIVPAKWDVREPKIRTRMSGDTAAGGLSLPELPPLSVTVSNATLLIERPDGPPVRATELSLELSRSRLRQRLAGSARGRMDVGMTPLGVFEVDLEGWGEHIELTGQVQDLDLAVLPFGVLPDWGGLARGKATLKLVPGRVEGSVDLEVVDFGVQVENFHAPIAPRTARIAGEFSWDGQTVSMRAAPLKLDEIEMTGEVSVGTGVDGRVTGAVEFAEFEPGDATRGRLQLVSLIGLRHQSWARLDERIGAGRFRGVRIEIDTLTSELGNVVGFRRRLQPEELRIVGEAEGGLYRASENGPPLEDIRGSFELAGNVLSIRDLHIMRAGNPLPLLDITIDGMHRLVHLPVEERQVPKGPGTSIDGIITGSRALRAAADNGRPPTQVYFDGLQVGYSPFLLPIRNARGILRFPNEKLAVDAPEAVVGGAPAQLYALFDPNANTLRVTVIYGDGEAPPRVDPGPHWASGSFWMPTFYVGDWRLDQVAGQLEATGANIAVRQLDGRFSSGPLRGFGSVAIGDPEAAHYEFFASISNADAKGLCEPLMRPDGSITGTLFVDGRFAGRLTPAATPLETAELGLAMRIENGTVGDLPALVYVARLPSLQGVRGLFGQDLPFKVVSADISMKEGVVRTENFALEGSELRLHARGEIDLVSDDLDSDFVLAFLFLETVDRMIGTVPILGQWLLGDDKSLLTLYLKADGPWEDPNVRPLAPGVVESAAGWAVKVVASGANQVRKILGVGPPDPLPELNESDSPR